VNQMMISCTVLPVKEQKQLHHCQTEISQLISGQCLCIDRVCCSVLVLYNGVDNQWHFTLALQQKLMPLCSNISAVENGEISITVLNKFIRVSLF